MKEKLYVYFLSSYKYEEKDNSEFNYKFSKRYSKEKYRSEFNKLLYKLNGIFYSKDKYVTSINSYDFTLPNNMVRHIIKLYKYALENSMLEEKSIIGDFLLTYYNTLYKNIKLGIIYKKTIEKYKKNIKEFNISYNEIYEDCLIYYKNAITYGIDNDIYISQNTIHKIMNNIKDKKDRNDIIKIMLKNDKYCTILIEYDNDVRKNKKVYLTFIKRILTQKSEIYNTPKVLIEMLNKNILADNEIIEIVNLYVENTNELCNKYKDKNEEFIGSLSRIESLRKSLLEIISTNGMNTKYKDKIHECLINILYLKRYLLLDDEYILSSMQEFSTETTISKEKIENLRKEIKNNKYKIYSISTINFNKYVEEAIDFYAKYPLGSIVSGFTIDTSNQTYYTNDKYAREYKYSFERYYENVGREYMKKNSKKLLNKLGKGYYIEMLRQLTRTFTMQQHLIIDLLGETGFDELIDDLKSDQNFNFKNNYEIIVANILITEININKALSNNSIKYTQDIEENLSLIFDVYKDDYIKRNGVMYIYYSLYECTGPNIRNKTMHGELLGKDLKIPILISFCCLIISSWIANGK